VRRALPILLAAALAVPTLAGCSSDGAKDCPSVARAVNAQVKALRTAVTHAAPGSDPRSAATALRQMQQDLDDLDSPGGGGQARSKAVGDLALAVSNVKNELDKQQSADIQPIVSAAAELTAACPAKG
jgi:hypothetical protein